jgi:hypothetical protein
MIFKATYETFSELTDEDISGIDYSDVILTFNVREFFPQ